MVTDASLRHIIWFTVWQATVSTVLTVAVALPGAYVLARYEFRGRAVVRALVTVPFVLPTVVVGSAFAGLLGPGGPLAGLGLDQTVWAILVAHVFFNYAVVVRTVGGLWAHLDPRQEEAARVLGAGRWRAFREVTLPALRPAVAASSAIVFLFTFTSFGVILILGGPRYSTLETEIYRQTTQFLNLSLAAALTVVQLVAIVGLLVVTGWIEGRRGIALRLRSATETARRPRTAGARAFLGANLLAMAVLLGVPLLVLVERSFHPPGGYGLGFYRALGEVHAGSTLFVAPVDAIANSLRFAAIATAIAVTVGGCGAFALASARRRGLDTFLSLPLGVSAVTVGFGFLIALDHAPFDLRGSSYLVPVAQALVAIPFVVRIHDAGAAGDRPAAPRGGRHPGRLTGAGLARGRPADRGPCRAGGGGIRVRHLARRVRRDGLHRAARRADAAGAHLPAARPAGSPELRWGDGRERDPHGPHRAGDPRHRALPRRVGGTF